jgi:GTPase involved in cell partitioning and DNA repair
MERYDKTLVRKPIVLLVNKVDIADGEEVFILPISI